MTSLARILSHSVTAVVTWGAVDLHYVRTACRLRIEDVQPNELARRIMRTPTTCKECLETEALWAAEESWLLGKEI